LGAEQKGVKLAAGASWLEKNQPNMVCCPKLERRRPAKPAKRGGGGRKRTGAMRCSHSGGKKNTKNRKM